MIFRRILIYIISILVMSVILSAQDRTLAVQKYDGTRDNYSFKEISYIRFPSGDIELVKKNQEVINFPIYSIQKMVYKTSTAVDTKSDESTLKAYPNPAEDYITISGITDLPQKAEIFNLFGEKVCELTVTTNEKTVEIGNLAKGVYFLRIFNNNIKFEKL